MAKTFPRYHQNKTTVADQRSDLQHRSASYALRLRFHIANQYFEHFHQTPWLLCSQFLIQNFPPSNKVQFFQKHKMQQICQASGTGEGSSLLITSLAGPD